MARSMNYGAVAKLLGRLMGLEALLLLVPAVVCLYCGEADLAGFVIASLLSAAIWGITELSTRRIPLVIHLREGFMLTASVWVAFGLTGIIPLMMCSHPLGLTDAMFETISGFTTTGASVFPDVGQLGKGVLLWRAEIQWIGGLGIIFFMLAMLPALNRSDGISLFNAEATGIYHTRLHPRIRQTVLSLWAVYSLLTLACILLLWAGPMTLFDAVCQTFTAISTGGFTTHTSGLAFWDSDYVYLVLTLFMTIGGLNFMLLYGVWKGRWRDLWRDPVTRTYLCFIVVAWGLQSLGIWLQGALEGHSSSSPFRSLVLFPLAHTVSAITSTGFTVEGAENWGQLSLMVTILLMIAGSCAGSTAGGVKTDRIMALGSNLRAQLLQAIFPRRQYVVRIGSHALDDGVVHRITAFFTIYLLLIGITTLLSLLCGYTLDDSLFLSASATGCNGLGYGVTGSGGGFYMLPSVLKWNLMLDMLAGRLELFTVLVLLVPSFWRR